MTSRTTHPKPKGYLRRIRLLFGTLSTLLLFVILSTSIFLAAVVGTNSGFRAALKLMSLAGVHVEVKEVKGTLWEGLTAQHLRLTTDSVTLESSALTWRFSPRDLWHKTLHINELNLGDVHINTFETNAPKSTPPTPFPKSVSLPFKVALDTLKVGQVTVNQQLVVDHATASYRFDSSQHQLEIQQVSAKETALAGSLNLGTTSPFRVQGKLDATGVMSGQEVRANLNVSGSLKAVRLRATARSSGHFALDFMSSIKPFRSGLSRKIIAVNLKVKSLNPNEILTTLPSAKLDVNLKLSPDIMHSGYLQVVVDAVNFAPQTLSAKGLPLTKLDGALLLNDQGVLDIQTLQAALLKNGSFMLKGTISNGALNLNGQLRDIKPEVLVTNVPSDNIAADVSVLGSLNNVQVAAQAKSLRLTSSANLRLYETEAGYALQLHEWSNELQKGGKLTLQGEVLPEQNQQHRFHFQALSSHFNPKEAYTLLPEGRLTGDIGTEGVLGDNFSAALNMKWKDSVLSGAPLNGYAKLLYEKKHLAHADVKLDLGVNHVLLHGSLGHENDSLSADIHLPAMHLLGFGLKGSLSAKGELSGRFERPKIDLTGEGEAIAWLNHFALQKLAFRVLASSDVKAPLLLDITGAKIDAAGFAIDRIKAKAAGSLMSHKLDVVLDGEIAKQDAKLNLALEGSLTNNYQAWRGRVNILDLEWYFPLRLQNPVAVEVASERLHVGKGSWRLLDGTLELNQLDYQKSEGWQSKGSVKAVALQHLGEQLKWPLQQNLVLDGQWDVSFGRIMQGFLNVKQVSGDVVLPYRQQPLQLNGTALHMQIKPSEITLNLEGSTRYAKVAADLVLPATALNATSAIAGNVALKLPALSELRDLLPVGVQVAGEANLNAKIAGSLTKPLFFGSLTGEKMQYVDRALGFFLEEGYLQAKLEGTRLMLQDLHFKRKGGDIAVTGVADFAGATAQVALSGTLKSYPILERLNRNLTLSGAVNLNYNPVEGMVLGGNLVTDHGHFGFPESGIGALDDDVIVEGKVVEKAKPLPVKLDLVLDLNNHFSFSGEGLNVLLGGKIHALAEPFSPLRVLGGVNIVEGQYKAYGQDLVIEKGLISFVGPVDNPSLQLRAVRRFSPVEAGVEVLGSLNNPRLSLVANQPMSEKDKLSWLILGRASGSGDEAALSAAAGAWLADNINSRLQLVDEFGLSSRQTRNSETGEMNPAEQIITLGKRLSDSLYLGYEYGIETATQTLKLTYQINKAFEAVGRISTHSLGGGIRYSVRFD